MALTKIGIDRLAKKKRFDPYQQIVAESYDGGDHFCSDPAKISRCGDSLLQFLMRELSEAQDCDSLECAINRIDTAVRQLLEVRAAFEARL